MLMLCNYKEITSSHSVISEHNLPQSLRNLGNVLKCLVET